MMHGYYGIVFELGAITFTGLDPDGYAIAQHDGQGTAPGVGHYYLEHPFGFISRPRDPDADKSGKPLPGKACSVLIGKSGDETHLFLASDPRFIPNIPQLKKGGAAMYSAPGSFRVLDGDDGTETFYCPVPGGSAHIITSGLDGNQKPFIGIEHSSGLAITMLEGSLVLKNADGSVYIEVNGSQIVLNGNVVLNGGATIGDPVGAQPAAIAPALLAYLQALEANITAAFVAVLQGPVATGQGGATAFQAGTAARATLMSAIAATKTSVA